MDKLAENQPNAPLDDPSALAGFGRLDVVARLVVEGFAMGKHKSPYKGASIEFIEHRQYYPGDEIRHIDWRAYGKTGKYYIKEFEDETNLRCYLIVDSSASMAYRASTISKFQYARQLASALAYLLLKQRDAVGLMTFDTKLRDRIDPSMNPRSFLQITKRLQARKPGQETSLSPVFEQLIPLMKRRSLVIILSDCYDDLDSLSAALRHLRHSRHEVVLFQIVAPEEQDFPFQNPTEFRSLESPNHRSLLDPHRMRARYLEQYQAFCRDLTSRCGDIGVEYQRIVTSQPYYAALAAFLDARSRQKGRRAR